MEGKASPSVRRDLDGPMSSPRASRVCVAKSLRRALTVLALLAGGVSTASAHATSSCPNAQLRAETGSIYLPDCRAYELVTPAYKDGHPVLAVSNAGRLAADGSHLIAQSLGAFGGTKDVPLGASTGGATYEIARTPMGWTPVSLTPPASQFSFDFAYESSEVVSADLRRTLWFANASQKELREQTNQTALQELYLQEPDGSFALLGPTAPQGEESERLIQGVVSDLSGVFVVLDRARWPGDATPQSNGSIAFLSLYQSTTAARGTEPKLVGVSNNGPLASNAEAKVISQCGTGLPGVRTEDAQLVAPQASYPWVPANGRTVYFKAFGKVTRPSCVEYEEQRTAHVASCVLEGKTTAECEAKRAAELVTCNKEAKVPPGQCHFEFGPALVAPEVGELYARLGGAKTIPVSEPSPPLCSSAACLKAAASERREAFFQGASEDGRHVFFTTTQPLANEDTDSTNDLYEAEVVGEGPSGKLASIVQVSKGSTGDPTPGSGAKVLGVAAVANDGSRVYFVAEGVLTSTPNSRGQSATAGSPNLYVVEPATGHTGFIATLSPSDEVLDWTAGAHEVQLTSDARFLVFRSGPQLLEYDAVAAAVTTVAREGAEARVASDGAVVFDSSAALTPRALNDPTHTFQNIYEYRNGQLALISDGHDVQGTGTTLLGIDPSGENIYFETFDRLVSQDTDTQRDIYDARVGGGFPAISPPAECSSDGCQGPATAPPQAPNAASLTQSAGGNLPPPAARATPTRSSRAQQLAKALKACHSQRSRRRRRRCEAQAKARYARSARTLSPHPRATPHVRGTR
jgi:hypothetical protein